MIILFRPLPMHLFSEYQCNDNNTRSHKIIIPIQVRTTNNLSLLNFIIDTEQSQPIETPNGGESTQHFLIPSPNPLYTQQLHNLSLRQTDSGTLTLPSIALSQLAFNSKSTFCDYIFKCFTYFRKCMQVHLTDGR